MFFEAMHQTWQNWLAQSLPMLNKLEQLIGEKENVVPEPQLVMRAFATDPKQIKVVIVGQDPYPTKGDAIGLAFAMNSEKKTPKSLVNIVTELNSDLGLSENVKSPNLAKWANQGVLLMNRTLTTEEGKAGAHSKLGWDEFTFLALCELAKRNKLVFILWGKDASDLGRRVAQEASNGSVLIESPHPSPLSAYRGFFGSKPFSKTNQELISMGLEPIDWSL
jgi:uracil-DNA glycosylase